MMFQSYALWPHMTAADNVGFGLRVRGWKKDGSTARITEKRKLLELEGFRAAAGHELSGR